MPEPDQPFREQRQGLGVHAGGEDVRAPAHTAGCDGGAGGVGGQGHPLCAAAQAGRVRERGVVRTHQGYCDQRAGLLCPHTRGGVPSH